METLDHRITRDGPLNELDAVGWAIRLARRLEALHALGVPHGSVSPACFATDAVDRNAAATLVDLRRAPESPAYHCPERVAGGSVSPADDVWALAATLYTAITGSPPFSGDGPEELRRRITAASPAPLAVFDVGDDELQRILDAAFTKDPSTRTSNAAAFREELERWHPDPSVKKLPPVEDEPTDDDEPRTMLQLAELEEEPSSTDGGVTVVKPSLLEDDDDDKTLLRPGGALLESVAMAALRGSMGAPRGPAGRPDPTPRTAAAAAAPRLEEDDEEDIRTIMRPLDDRLAPGAPQDAGTSRFAQVRPAAGAPAIVQPAPGPGPGVRLEDDEDDDARTMLRDGPSLLAATEGMGARRAPHPAAGIPAQSAPGTAAHPGFGIGLGHPHRIVPDPQVEPMTSTVAFPPGAFDHLNDPAHGAPGGSSPPGAAQLGSPSGGGPPPGFAHAGAFAPAGPPGSQPGAPPAFPPPGAQAHPGFTPGAQGLEQRQYPQPFGVTGAPLPASDPPSARSSVALAIVVALVALVVAAGVTFLVLRSRATGGGFFGAALDEPNHGLEAAQGIAVTGTEARPRPGRSRGCRRRGARRG